MGGNWKGKGGGKGKDRKENKRQFTWKENKIKEVAGRPRSSLFLSSSNLHGSRDKTKTKGTHVNHHEFFFCPTCCPSSLQVDILNGLIQFGIESELIH